MVPLVSVIVPVLNGERTIRACLASLLRLRYPAARREILVVDNGSTDRTVAVVGEYPVGLLRGARRGAAAARNAGIEACRGEIVAFTDADCVVATRWLEELVAGFIDDAVGGVEGETLAYPPATRTERYVARQRSYSYEARRASPLAPFVVTANVAFRREVFARIGLFDTRFPAAGGEDVDFTWRFVSQSGLRLAYNPQAVVFHQHRRTTRGFFAQRLRNGRALAILRAKYPERLPWTGRQELRAWVAVMRLAGSAGRSLVRSRRPGDPTADGDPLLAFLGKFSRRLGFLWGMLASARR